jgi:hypothetical protein
MTYAIVVDNSVDLTVPNMTICFTLHLDAKSKSQEHTHKETFEGHAIIDGTGGTSSESRVGPMPYSIKLTSQGEGDFSADLNLGYLFKFPDWDIPQILQKRLFDCWAAGAAVLLSWRDTCTYTVESVLDQAGSNFRTIYQQGNPITPKDFQHFIESLGLEAEPNISKPYAPCDFLEMLLAYGPIFVVVNPNPSGAGSIYHTLIIIGVEDWEDTAKSKIHLYDPNTGKFGDGAYTKFNTIFENISVHGFRPRFVHLPRATKSEPAIEAEGAGYLKTQSHTKSEVYVGDSLIYTNAVPESNQLAAKITVKDHKVLLEVEKIGIFEGEFISNN